MEISTEIEGENAVATQSLTMIKQLAAVNNTTRSRALRWLTSWLPSQVGISDDDMKKIWKGLFYCVWHSDKVPVQTQLINRLSSLLFSLDLPVAVQYFSVFLLTVRREWSGIDVLRLDKFYLLIRRFIHSVFQLLKKNGWDPELTQRLMGVLEERTFLADDKVLLGNGVNYHIVSVFLEELKTFLPVKEETLEILFKPFLSVMQTSKDKVLLGKIKSNVFVLLLKMGKELLQQKKDSAGDVGNVEIVNLGTIALTMGFASRFYGLGSSPECFQGNRKAFFKLHEEFLKLENDLKASGITISIPMVTIEDDDDVPELVPIVGDESRAIASKSLLEPPEVLVEGGAKKSSKKKKKEAKDDSKKKNKEAKDDSKKKKKEAKDDSKHGSHKKRKTADKNENGNVFVPIGENLSNGVTNNASNITFTDCFKSNLQMEFEKVAKEEGFDKDSDTSLLDPPLVAIKSAKIAKKRKRGKTAEIHESYIPDVSEQEGAAAKSGEKSIKKVRFSKNNLVWKPQTPLPPQIVRIPPSVTPRGSALKKGVPPGPIREMPPATRNLKKKKRGKKLLKTTSPAVKRMRKLQKISI